MGEVHLHARTCTPLFHISGTAGRIFLTFGGWLGTQNLGMRFMQGVGWAPMHVRTCISNLPIS